MALSNKFIADFDSTTSMVVALGGCLRGSDAPGGGSMLVGPRWLARLINALPRSIRRTLYRLSGWWDAVPARALQRLQMDDIYTWVTDQYPQRQFPAVMIGSSNGAAAHLCAALGIPMLPQTFLVPVRRRMDPDALKEDIEWGRKVAAGVIERFPDILMHQMHDPIQDRLMVERMGYFRVKMLRMGKIYEKFMEEVLAPHGTIILLECGLRWPAVRVQERHLFQSGGYGALTPQEILDGSERIQEFLKRQGSSLQRLDVPTPDMEAPEAEWGFDETLGDDVRRFAEEHGHKILRIRFRTPDDLSPLVADLYRWWYEKRGITTSCLLGECFALLEPWWAMRTAAVPYWIGFNTSYSADIMEKYLDDGRCFPEIHLMIMSNGIESVGIVPAERWWKIARRGERAGSLLGMEGSRFPLDLGSFGRYHAEFTQRVSARHPLPLPLTLEEMNEFAEQKKGRYGVEVS